MLGISNILPSFFKRLTPRFRLALYGAKIPKQDSTELPYHSSQTSILSADINIVRKFWFWLPQIEGAWGVYLAKKPKRVANGYGRQYYRNGQSYNHEYNFVSHYI